MENTLTEQQKKDSQSILLIAILSAFLVPYFITLFLYLGMQCYLIKTEQIFKIQRIWIITFIYGLVGISLNLALAVLLMLLYGQFTLIALLLRLPIIIISLLVAVISWKYRKLNNENNLANS